MSDQGASMLQNELNRLYEWTDKFQMELNVGKCSYLGVGSNNPLHKYCLNTTPISDRDLEVFVSSDLRPKIQCILARN